MRRRYLTLAVVSGLLCAATVGLWVRCYWTRTAVWTGDTLVLVVEGTVYFRWGTQERIFRDPDWALVEQAADTPNGDRLRTVLTPTEIATTWRARSKFTDKGLAGFGYGEWSGLKPPFAFAYMPLWFPVLTFGLLTAIFIYVGRRRIASPHCLSCGYDLRTTPEKCPECGTINRQIPIPEIRDQNSN